MAKERTRESAIESVNNLLGSVPLDVDAISKKETSKQKQYLEDAIRMVDREIGGLLGHPKSPFSHTYRMCTQTLFPSGLERTSPGNDIIISLNSDKVLVKGRELSIPKELKNPEKGVAQVIGIDLAKTLFSKRKVILGLLLNHDSGWQKNLDTHNKAEEVLENYNRAIHRESGSEEHNTECSLFPCIENLIKFIIGAGTKESHQGVEGNHSNFGRNTRVRI